MRLTYVELFAGAGGLSMGLDMAGWECLGHCEIEEFPRRVLAERWPGVPLHGDVTALTGAAIIEAAGGEAPLLLSGGSPCQDLSVAGKRKGLGGERSSLFHHQMRLWDETGARYCLWENVLGAFSSHNGRDFAAVLSSFVGSAIAVPADGWGSSGVAAGRTGVAAWRVLDAKYFGVPQRRRRVFVLGTRAGGVDPSEVLSVADRVSRDLAPRSEAGQGVAADAAGGARGTGVAINISNGEARIDEVMGTLQARPSGGQDIGKQMNAVLPIPLLEVGKRQGNSAEGSAGIGQPGDPMFTLQAGAKHGVMAWDSEFNPTGDLSGTLTARTKSGTTAAGVVAFNTDGRGAQVSEIAPTLQASAARISNQIQGVISFYTKATEVTVGEEVSPPLRAMNEADSKANGGGQMGIVEVASPLTTRCGEAANNDGPNGSPQNLVVAFAQNQRGEVRTSDVAPSLNVGGGKPGEGYPAVVSFKASHFTRGKDGAPSDVASPLSADADKGDQDQLVYDARGNGDGAVVPTLAGDHQDRVTDYTAIVTARMVAFGEYVDDGTASCLQAHLGKDAQDLVVDVVGTLASPQKDYNSLQSISQMQVTAGVPRRLTPLECERLMGWPDTHTALAGAKDAPRYKACGNGVATPVAAWIGFRLRQALTGEDFGA